MLGWAAGCWSADGCCVGCSPLDAVQATAVDPTATASANRPSMRPPPHSPPGEEDATAAGSWPGAPGRPGDGRSGGGRSGVEGAEAAQEVVAVDVAALQVAGAAVGVELGAPVEHPVVVERHDVARPEADLQLVGAGDEDPAERAQRPV